ncbi:MAG: hypothetical protein AB1758_29385, partial [Candidatus Eremiobacterota bacterium]
IRQRGGRGDDDLSAEASGRRNRIRQRGGPGDDDLSAEASGRRNMVRQRGGPGDDELQVEVTGRRNRVRQRGGRGDDVLTARLGSGRTRGTLRGGPGYDSAVLYAEGQPVKVVGADGRLLYQNGRGGAVIRVLGVEHLTIVNGDESVSLDLAWPQSSPD